MTPEKTIDGWFVWSDWLEDEGRQEEAAVARAEANLALFAHRCIVAVPLYRSRWVNSIGPVSFALRRDSVSLYCRVSARQRTANLHVRLGDYTMLRFSQLLMSVSPQTALRNARKKTQNAVAMADYQKSKLESGVPLARPEAFQSSLENFNKCFAVLSSPLLTPMIVEATRCATG